MFQKFYGGSYPASESSLVKDYPDLFEITDSLQLNRGAVAEALLEYGGVPVDEAVILDAGFGQAEVLGFARGQLSPDLVNELRAQAEYHFNTVGKISVRKGKTTWTAKPSGPSKLIAYLNSPEIILEEGHGSIKIRIKQSLKTYNKFFAPAIAAALGGFMLIAANMFGAIGDDGVAPSLVVSALLLTASFLYSRFVNGRKNKRKKALAELAETLQQTIERRHHVSQRSSASEVIPLADREDSEEAVNHTEQNRVRT